MAISNPSSPEGKAETALAKATEHDTQIQGLINIVVEQNKRIEYLENQFLLKVTLKK